MSLRIPAGLDTHPPGALARLRAAIADVRANKKSATLCLIGDSTTMGAGAHPATQMHRLQSYPSLLARLLNAYGVPAENDSFFGQGQLQGTIVNENDARLACSGGWAIDSSSPFHTTIGGPSIGAKGAGSLSFTPTNAADADRVAIYYAGSGTGSFSVNIGGETLAVVDTSTVAEKFASTILTLAAPAKNPTVNLVWVSGEVWIVGVHVYSSTANTMRVFNFGSGAAKSADIVRADAPWNFLPAALSIPAAAWVVMIGINDWIHATPLDVFSSNQQALVFAARPSRDLILMTPFPSAPSSTPVATQMRYVDAIRDLALRNDLPCIDVYGRLNSWDRANRYGMAWDAYHPSSLGYEAFARNVVQAILHSGDATK